MAKKKSATVKQKAARKKFANKAAEAKAMSKRTGKKYTTCIKEVYRK